jgi:TPR repeat protein
LIITTKRARQFGHPAFGGLSLALTFFIVQAAHAGWPEADAAAARGDDAGVFREWLQLAQQGNPLAENNVGFAFERGKGVSVDFQKAQDWYAKAASTGLAEAEKNLGLMYAMGHGLKPDVDREIFWLRKAAVQGHPQASFLLGSILLGSNSAEGVGWINQAAEQGYAHADYKLGTLYDEGKFVARDYILAYKWFSIAARIYPPGDFRDQTTSALGGLERKLTAEQRSSAEALAAAWKPTEVPTPVPPTIPLAPR